MRLGEDTRQKVPSIPTGAIGLDVNFAMLLHGAKRISGVVRTLIITPFLLMPVTGLCPGSGVRS